MSCCVEQTNGIAGGGAEAAVDAFDVGPDALQLVPSNVSPATTTPLNLGIPNTTSGGGTHPALANTSVLEATPRWRATSAVGAGSSAGHRSVTPLWLRGSIANVGGFRYRARFGVSAFVSGFRAFIGLNSTTGALPTADPSALLDMVGIAYDLGQTQWRMMHNNGAGAATQIPLGASFNVVANDLLVLEMMCLANAATLDYRVTNLTTLVQVTGTIAAELPTNTVILCSHAWVNTGNVAATAAQIDIARIAVAPPV